MTLVLTTKAEKLMKLCEVEGYKSAHDLVQAVWTDSVCPAIRPAPARSRNRRRKKMGLAQGQPQIGVHLAPPVSLPESLGLSVRSSAGLIERPRC
jgi:hypothetical protein